MGVIQDDGLDIVALNKDGDVIAMCMANARREVGPFVTDFMERGCTIQKMPRDQACKRHLDYLRKFDLGDKSE